MEMGINNKQVDKMTYPVDVSQPVIVHSSAYTMGTWM